MAAASAPDVRIEVGRRIGLTSAAALGVANMIGVGAFTTSGFALGSLGRPEPVLLAWLVGGVLATCGALSYGALARRFPESGGEYTYISRTIHPVAGFVSGWISLVAGFTAPIAAAALAFHAYLADATGLRLPTAWVATAVILAAGVMHGLRLHPGVFVQNAVVGLKLALIAGFVAVGLVRLPAGSMVAPLSLEGVEPTAFAVTMVWISFAYSGWNAATYVGGHVTNPGRNLPRALWLPTVVVTIAYVSMNAVFLYAAPVDVLSGRADVAAVAAQALGGPWLGRVISVIVVLALFTSISSMVMAGPRVYARMAEDGLLPRFIATEREVPAAAVALQTGLAAVAVWVAGLPELLACAGFMLGLCAATAVCGLFALRRREGALRVPAPGYPWVPGLFVVATLGASAFMVLRQPLTALVGVLIAAAGLPLYWLMTRSTAGPGPELIGGHASGPRRVRSTSRTRDVSGDRSTIVEERQLASSGLDPRSSWTAPYFPVAAWKLGTWRLSLEREPFAADELAAAYDRAAQAWPRVLARRGVVEAYATLFRRVESSGALYGLRRGGRVLDCGVGTGALSYALATSHPAPFEIDAVDISPEMLLCTGKVLRGAGVAARLRRSDAREMPYASNSFDLVMSAHMLEHLSDPLVALQEMVRVLKPGAMLLLLVTRRGILGGWLSLRWRVRQVEEQELRAWLGACGVVDVECRPLEGSWWCRRTTLACVARKGAGEALAAARRASG